MQKVFTFQMSFTKYARQYPTSLLYSLLDFRCGGSKFSISNGLRRYLIQNFKKLLLIKNISGQQKSTEQLYRPMK